MSAHRFFSAKGGNVSMFFAFSLIPVIGMIGFAVDFTRASNAREKVAAALDAAALNANRNATLNLADKTKIAKEVIAAQLQDAPWIKYDAANITVTDSSGLLDVKMNGTVKTSFVAMLGINEMQVSAAAQSINRIEDGAEIALVLDNTGSMRNDMTTLKSSVTSFINTVMPVAAGQVKVAIVPYVASVNPGPAAMAGLMDYQANATHHAQLFETGPMCPPRHANIHPNDDGGGGGGGGGGPPPFDPGKGGNEGGASAGNWLDRFASLVAIGNAEAAARDAQHGPALCDDACNAQSTLCNENGDSAGSAGLCFRAWLGGRLCALESAQGQSFRPFRSYSGCSVERLRGGSP